MFYILSCGNESFDFLSLILLILFLGFNVLIIYGVNKLCKDIIENNYKKNWKLLAFASIIILLLILLFYSRKDILSEPCNQLGPIFSVGIALFKINQIFLSLALIIMGIYKLIKYFIIKRSNEESNVKLLRAAITYITAGLIVFCTFFLLSEIINYVSDGILDNPNLWSQCWCRD